MTGSYGFLPLLDHVFENVDVMNMESAHLSEGTLITFNPRPTCSGTNLTRIMKPFKFEPSLGRKDAILNNPFVFWLSYKNNIHKIWVKLRVICCIHTLYGIIR